jgi:hypothetical protein
VTIAVRSLEIWLRVYRSGANHARMTVTWLISHAPAIEILEPNVGKSSNLLLDHARSVNNLGIF